MGVESIGILEMLRRSVAKRVGNHWVGGMKRAVWGGALPGKPTRHPRGGGLSGARGGDRTHQGGAGITRQPAVAEPSCQVRSPSDRLCQARACCQWEEASGRRRLDQKSKLCLVMGISVL